MRGTPVDAAEVVDQGTQPRVGPSALQEGLTSKLGDTDASVKDAGLVSWQRFQGCFTALNTQIWPCR
jgi:hypothetical protein